MWGEVYRTDPRYAGAVTEGEAARSRGVAYESNPYPATRQSYHAWAVGWIWRDYELERAGEASQKENEK